MSDAPQWLIPSWLRACREAGATASDAEIEHLGRQLIAHWREPSRRFHTLRHVVEVLSRVDELAEETHAPALVRIAAWYHGAVFCPGGDPNNRPGEDKLSSAALAKKQLPAIGLAPEDVERVSQLVSALHRHVALDPADVDAAVLSDADIAVLAVEPQRYATYLKTLREEYAHLPLGEYLAARVSIITALLSRRRIFRSPRGSQWEETARQNLQLELHRVRKELAKLDPAHIQVSPVETPQELGSTHMPAPQRDHTEPRQLDDVHGDEHDEDSPDTPDSRHESGIVRRVKAAPAVAHPKRDGAVVNVTRPRAIVKRH